MQNKHVLLILPLLFAVGCGGDIRVTGTVKLSNGSPLTDAAILFESATASVFSHLDDGGNFTLYQMYPGDGVPPGVYRGQIQFDTSSVLPESLTMDESRWRALLEERMPFSTRYLSFETSELTLTVERGKPVHLDIVLE